jgi:hypothetical protein
VVVDHAGNDGAAAQVDTPRLGPRQSRDVLIGTNGDDAIATDRNRLRDRELIVNGDDLSVRQNRIRRRLLCADQDRSSNDPGCQEHVHRSFHGRFSIP